jgi:hypothetical protein
MRIRIFNYRYHFLRCTAKTGYNFVGMFFFILITLTLSIIVFCYAHVLKVINDVREDSSNSYDSVQCTDIKKKTLKKVLTYILVFIVQHIPILVYNICLFLKVIKEKKKKKK